MGKCTLVLNNTVTGKKYDVEFQVVKEDLTLLISQEAAEMMQLITVNYNNFKQLHSVNKDSENTVTNHSSIFDNDGNIGCLPRMVSVKVDEHAKGTQCPPQHVPVSVKPKLKKELDNLVKLGVITPVSEPTDWCSQILIQEKWPTQTLHLYLY